jgi:hypothetical protein
MKFKLQIINLLLKFNNWLLYKKLNHKHLIAPRTTKEAIEYFEKYITKEDLFVIERNKYEILEIHNQVKIDRQLYYENSLIVDRIIKDLKYEIGKQVAEYVKIDETDEWDDWNKKLTAKLSIVKFK